MFLQVLCSTLRRSCLQGLLLDMTKRVVLCLYRLMGRRVRMGKYTTLHIYTMSESFKLIKSQWSGNFYKYLEFWGTFLKTLMFHTLMYVNIFRAHSASLGRFVPHHPLPVWRKAPLNRRLGCPYAVNGRPTANINVRRRRISMTMLKAQV